MFYFNSVRTPWSYLYESSNHNTKYMSAKEILSKTRKIPLMYFSMQRVVRVLEALFAWKKWCMLTLFFGLPSETTHRLKTVLLFQQQTVSFGFLVHSLLLRFVYFTESQSERWNVWNGREQSRLDFSQVLELTIDFFFNLWQNDFHCCSGVEKIGNYSEGGSLNRENKTSQAESFCQIFIESCRNVLLSQQCPPETKWL